MSTPVRKEILQYEFFDVEIKYGLLQVSEGLAFLHNDVKLLFRNLCPENIILTKKGVWKLFGFEFCAQPINPGETPLKFPFFNIVNHTSDYPALLLPNLDYVAPEYYDTINDVEANEEERTVGLTSDMYSLGCITFTLYNQGKCLLPTANQVCSLSSSRIKKLHAVINNSDRELCCIPEDSRYHIKLLLSVDKFFRPDAVAFSKLNIFEDIHVRTLQYLDSLFQWDNLEKANFYKGLPEILNAMPLRVRINRVLPALSKEFINPDMVPFVLPNYFLIVEEMEDGEFISVCLPQLQGVFQMKEPIQISMILMQKVELVIKKCKKNQEVVKNQILPMICRCFEVDATQIQELCLQTVPAVTSLVEQSLIKNSILPRIKRLCLHSSSLSIKVNCLLCLGKIIEFLDKWLVIDEIVSFLPEIHSKEPAVVMAIVGIYQLSFSHQKLGLTKEVLCSKVIPHLMPLAIENGLTVAQFETIIALVKSMVGRVESEHKVKLEQLNSIKSQHSMSVISFNAKQTSTATSGPSKTILTSASSSSLPASRSADSANCIQELSSPIKSSSSTSLKDKLSSPLVSFMDQGHILTPNNTSSQSGSTPVCAQSVNAFVQAKDLTSTLLSNSIPNSSVGGINQLNQINSSGHFMPARTSANYGAFSNLSSSHLPTSSPASAATTDYHQTGSAFKMLAIEAKPPSSSFSSSTTSSHATNKPNLAALDNIPVSDLMKTSFTDLKPTKRSLNQIGGQFSSPQITMRSSAAPQLPNYSLSQSTPKSFAKLEKSDLDQFLN